MYQPSPIMPTFDAKNQVIDPKSYVIDCGNYNMLEQPETHPDLCEKMKQQFKNKGLVLLTNTGLANNKSMIEVWSKIPLGNTWKYEGGANERNYLKEEGTEEESGLYDVGAPGNMHMNYHHEMTQVRLSTEALVFSMVEGIGRRGGCWLSDSLKVTQDMNKTALGQKIQQHGICYIRNFTNRNRGNWCEWKGMTAGTSLPGQDVYYNHWQQAFGTEDMKVVEEKCRQQEMEFHWGPNDLLRTKFFTGGYEYFPLMDKNVLYASISEHGTWFDTHIGLKDLPHIETYETGTELERPYKMCLGNMEEFTQSEIEEWAALYCKHGFQVGGEKAMDDGDINIFCNFRFAHGRPSFQLKEGEKRDLGVVIGKMYERIGPKVGKY